MDASLAKLAEPMRALVLERYNAPFILTEVTRPAANAGQVLVRIKASGVNPLDTKIPDRKCTSRQSDTSGDPRNGLVGHR